MNARLTLLIGLLAGQVLLGQEAPPAGSASAAQPAAQPNVFVVESGVRIPLSLINSVSTKHSAEGDRVYLQTAFPVLVNGRIVVPVGSYVAGTVTQVKKPGRTSGRGELYIRFDSLTLPNGVTRDFHGRIGGMDGTTAGTLDREEGKIKSDGGKGADLKTIGETTAAGTSVGAIAGNAAGHGGMGLGIGAGAGAAAGLLAVLATRGPDATLEKGATVEMVLDRSLSFAESEVDFGGSQQRPPQLPQAAPSPASKSNSAPIINPVRKLPIRE